MMKKRFIKESIGSLKGIKGCSIRSCLRLFSESAFEAIPEDKRQQEADASTYVIISDGNIFGFYPNSEKFTIQVEKLQQNKLPNNLSNVSGNQFWRNRVGKKIINVDLLYSVTDAPYGVRFDFDNGLKAELHYVSESEYTFDALIVR